MWETDAKRDCFNPFINEFSYSFQELNKLMFIYILQNNNNMQIGIIGSGSWATAIAKILTDNGNTINWWVRKDETISIIKKRKHNPHYLSSAYFDLSLINLSASLEEVVSKSSTVVIALPSAYIQEALSNAATDIFDHKRIISAVKGILPQSNLLLQDYLEKKFKVHADNYFTLLGPCHAEEVAAEKLSYLTFSGNQLQRTQLVADAFKNDYINTITNTDLRGAQYAAVLKNIYALGAGIAHGLEYGDNFLSVFIANAAKEMNSFLKIASPNSSEDYSSSVYLGDLLVTCYSLYSRNRTFGNMIGKGYSVKSAQLELNMVAEGYNASKCIHLINKNIHAQIPVADTIFSILWERIPAAEGFKTIETLLR